MSNSSKLWNGDISKWPSFKTDVQMALQREKCGSIIIPFGSRGHVAAIVDRPFPPIQYLGPDGVPIFTQRAVLIATLNIVGKMRRRIKNMKKNAV